MSKRGAEQPPKKTPDVEELEKDSSIETVNDDVPETVEEVPAPAQTTDSSETGSKKEFDLEKEVGFLEQKMKNASEEEREAQADDIFAHIEGGQVAFTKEFNGLGKNGTKEQKREIESYLAKLKRANQRVREALKEEKTSPPKQPARVTETSKSVEPSEKPLPHIKRSWFGGDFDDLDEDGRASVEQLSPYASVLAEDGDGRVSNTERPDRTPSEEREYLKSLVDALTEVEDNATAEEQTPVSPEKETHEGPVDWTLQEPAVAEPTEETEDNKEKTSASPEEFSEAEAEYQRTKHFDETARTLAEDAGLEEERDAMLSAEQTFLDARYSAKRKLPDADPARTKEAQENYNVASANFMRKLDTRLSEGKDALVEKLRASTDESGSRLYTDEDITKRVEGFSRRYQRMIVSRDVIVRGEDRLKTYESRALDEKGQSVLQKGLTQVARGNQWFEQKVGKKSARALRIFGSAMIGAGAASVLYPATAVFGVTAVGVRLFRGLAGGYLGTVSGGVVGHVYEGVRGRQLRARDVRARESSALTSSEVEAKRKAYRAGSDESIEHTRQQLSMWTAILTGAGFSIGTSTYLAHLESVQDAVTKTALAPAHLAPHDLDSSFDTSTAHSPFLYPEPGAPLTPEHAAGVVASAHAGSAIVGHAETASAALSPEHPVPSVEVSKGSGYEHMVGELQKKLTESGQDFPKDSDAYALAHAKPHELNGLLHKIAGEHHFVQADGSVRVDQGSTLTLDAHGNLLFHQGGHGAGIVDATKNMPVTPSPEMLSAEQSPLPDQTQLPDSADAHGNVPSAENGTLDAPEHVAEAAPVPHEVVGAVPEGVASHAAVIHTLERGPAFTNAHGVHVDPARPSAYELPAANGQKNIFVSGGGLGDKGFIARRDFINLIAQKPEFQGKTLFVDVSEVKPDGTAIPEIAQFVIGKNGAVGIGPSGQLSPANRVLFERTVDSFTKKII